MQSTVPFGSSRREARRPSDRVFPFRSKSRSFRYLRDMDLKTCRFEQVGSTGVIFLPRPKRRNAWTGRMHTEYRWLLQRAEADTDFR